MKIRNMASSIDALSLTMDDMVWNDWTIAKAVRDGYKVSGWVYKAVSIIAENLSVIPFVVKDKDNEIEWNHQLTELLLKPHPFLSRPKFYELLIQWLMLAGNAYIKKANGMNYTRELWPISPDKITPVSSENGSEFISGYKVKNKEGKFIKSNDYTLDNIVHLYLIDPSNPILGISPLQALAKTVDGDVAQQNWNAAAMQNRGVVDGVFTFDRDLDRQQTQNIIQRIMEKFSGKENARKPLVIGSKAQYTRLSLTAAEMDFLESRKYNRDEIFSVFGVPPQLAGSQEASTYNNFSTAMRIFWESKIIPLANMLAAQFTGTFENQLDNERYIHFDLSNISAIRENESDKAKTAKLYFEMGVPFKQINDKFEMGVEEFEGWDLPYSGKSVNQAQETKQRKAVLIPTEKRSIKKEVALKEKIATGPAVKVYTDFLEKQKKAVYASFEDGFNVDPAPIIRGFDKELNDITRDLFIGVAAQFANTVVVDTRGKPLNFQRREELEDSLIQEFLKQEQLILEETASIQNSTIATIIEQLQNAIINEFTPDQLRRALDDTGLFDPVRALRIARTETGTAASIGQLAGAAEAGATHKVWEISGNNTRAAHVARDGEEVEIDGRFSQQISGIGPRYPLDPQLSAGDRINCDCYLSFFVE